MSNKPFIKFFSSDFLAGTSGLSPAERGVYITLLCLIFEQDGPIARDDARLSRRCGAPKAAFVRILECLIEQGKVHEEGGKLTNRRAEKAIDDRAKRTQNSTHAANQRWSAEKEKSQQIQGKGDATAMRAQCAGICQPEPEPEPDKDNPPNPPLTLVVSEPDKPGPIEQVVEAWNLMAGEAELAKVSQITEVRRKTWNSRIKEAGGVDAVIAIIKAIPESDLLAGRVRARDGGKPWKATFDWIGKQGNWTKLIEGQYHGGEPPKTRTVSKEDREAMVRRQMEARQALNGRVV